MKLVRAVAVLVGLADLAFAVWFLVGSGGMPGVGALVYPMWAGVGLLGSAALLFLVASDPERFFPIVFIIIGGRALATVVALFVLKGIVILAVGISEGALTAILVLVILHAIRQRRAASAEVLEATAREPHPAKPAGPGPGESKPGETKPEETKPGKPRPPDDAASADAG